MHSRVRSGLYLGSGQNAGSMLVQQAFPLSEPLCQDTGRVSFVVCVLLDARKVECHAVKSSCVLLLFLASSSPTSTSWTSHLPLSYLHSTSCSVFLSIWWVFFHSLTMNLSVFVFEVFRINSTCETSLTFSFQLECLFYLH